MTPKKRPKPPPILVNTSYRGYRSRAGAYFVDRDTEAFQYPGASTVPGEVAGPWRWGPRQEFSRLLAWALLVDVLDDPDEADQLADQFNQHYVSKFHPMGWMMSADNIRAAARRLADQMVSHPPRKPR